MSQINVHNEWDPIEEIIVGRATNAQIPCADLGLFAVDFAKYGYDKMQNIPSGLYDQKIIDETEEDLDLLIQTLQEIGIVVKRPDVVDHSIKFRTPNWESDGRYNYCPRDVFVAIGNWLIEAPMAIRARLFESLSFKALMLEYLQNGAKWISAPKPQLSDNTYNFTNPQVSAINNYEPIFDAANILRLGRDIFYLVSDTGNLLGALWLQALLGEEYKVHTCDNIYAGTHVDSTISPIRPGLVVVNAERVGELNLPDLFKQWDVIYLEEIVDTGCTGIEFSSKWLGMNLLMVNPNLAIVDKHQVPLIRLLEKRNVDVIPLELRHSRTLGGGFHCVTLDVRRKGLLEKYS